MLIYLCLVNKKMNILFIQMYTLVGIRIVMFYIFVTFCQPTDLCLFVLKIFLSNEMNILFFSDSWRCVIQIILIYFFRIQIM